MRTNQGPARAGLEDKPPRPTCVLVGLEEGGVGLCLGKETEASEEGQAMAMNEPHGPPLEEEPTHNARTRSFVLQPCSCMCVAAFHTQAPRAWSGTSPRPSHHVSYVGQRAVAPAPAPFPKRRDTEAT